MNSEAIETKAVRVDNTFNEETNPGRRIKVHLRCPPENPSAYFRKKLEKTREPFPRTPGSSAQHPHRTESVLKSL